MVGHVTEVTFLDVLDTTPPCRILQLLPHLGVHLPRQGRGGEGGLGGEQFAVVVLSKELGLEGSLAGHGKF